VQYRPGKLNYRTDTLIRRPGDFFQTEDNPRRIVQQQIVLKPENISPEIREDLYLGLIILAEESENNQDLGDISDKPTIQNKLQELITKTYKKDLLAVEMVKALRKRLRRVKRFFLAEYELKKNKIYYKNRLFIPENNKLRLKIFQIIYDSTVGGHPGRTKLIEFIARKY
jgi:hypothetical protein